MKSVSKKNVKPRYLNAVPSKKGFLFLLTLLAISYLLEFSYLSYVDYLNYYQIPVYIIGFSLIVLSFFMTEPWKSRVILLESVLWVISILFLREYYRTHIPGLLSMSNLHYYKELYYLDIVNLLIRGYIVTCFILRFSRIKIFLTLVSLLIVFIVEHDWYLYFDLDNVFLG